MEPNSKSEQVEKPAKKLKMSQKHPKRRFQ